MEIYHITPAIVSLEMKMATLSPKDSSISLCSINCKITEKDKNIKIVLHNKAIVEEIFVYKATMMIQEEQKQACIIIDNNDEIALIVL